MTSWDYSLAPDQESKDLFFRLLSEERFSEIGQSMFKNNDPFFNTRLVNSALNGNCKKKDGLLDPSSWPIPQSSWKVLFSETLIQNGKVSRFKKWSLLENVLITNHLGALEALGQAGIYTSADLSRMLPSQDCDNWSPLTLVATLHTDPYLLPLMKCLVQFGADINYPNQREMTPLATAVLRGTPGSRLQAIQWMVTEGGASLGVKLKNPHDWGRWK